MEGKPGSYLRLNPPRASGWLPRDRLSFDLPMKLRATRYTGLSTIAGYERFAVEFGPVLLALVGAPWNTTLDSMLVTGVVQPGEPNTWLEPITSADAPMHFRLRGSVPAPAAAMVWKPYYEVEDELFEVYQTGQTEDH